MRIRKFVAFAMVLCTLTAVSACSESSATAIATITGPGPIVQPPAAVSSVSMFMLNKKISNESCNVEVEFGVSIQPSTATQKVDSWTSTGGTFLSKGDTTSKIRFTSAGHFTVTAKAGDKTASETIEITGSNCVTPVPGPPTPPPPPPPTPTLVVSPLSLTLLPISCSGSGLATQPVSANMSVTWASSNSHVASVNPTSNTTAVVSGINPGSATIVATGPQGQTANVNVTVGQCPTTPTTPPTVGLTANPGTIQSGQSSTLTATSTNATACTWSGGLSGPAPTSGNQSVSPTVTTTYTLTCTGPGGSASASATVTVTPVANVCAGASASLPDLTAKGQTRGFAINVPAGCQWVLDSNNHHVVSVNPAQGTGPSSGTVTSLNSGTATIRFLANGVVISSRVYIIP